MADDIAFSLPSLGADMDKGRVARWLKTPGQSIHRGDAIVQVETDKGLIDVECFDDATFDAALVPEGAEVAVGTPIARLHVEAHGAPPGTPPSSASSSTAAAPPSTAESPNAAMHEPSATAASAAKHDEAHGDRVYATPLARRRAGDLHVDLRTVEPADGRRICLEDVLRVAHAGEAPSSSAPKSTPPARVLAFDAAVEPRPAPSTSSAEAPLAPSVPKRNHADARQAMRDAIAAAMARSKREIPHYYLWHTVDAGPAQAWLDAANAVRPVTERLLFAAMLVRAVALAAAEFPEMNGRWADDGFVASDDVNVCFATALRGGGLIAPAIERADRLDIDATMRAIASLVQRVRGGGLTAREMTSGTITVTSLGDVDVQGVLPVIQPPQVAIVGFGSVVDRVVVDGAVPRVGRAITVTLAGDHRVSDGHRGARFVQAIARRLLHPSDP